MSTSDMTEATADPTAVFEATRPRLWALAYRMLGSAADADDAVQDTYLKWQSSDIATIEHPEAWLTTLCTRRCIDMLRAAHRTRVDYVGPWLPEPVTGEPSPNAADAVELASSLSTAFLLLLERLTPYERAAYLLREVFDYEYDTVANLLDKTPVTCRKLVSRAREHVSSNQSRFTPQPNQQAQLLNEFIEALQSGTVERLEALLARDAELWADGGGKVAAVREVIHGAGAIAGFLEKLWHLAWHRQRFEHALVNGAPGLIQREGDQTVAVMSFAMSADRRIESIFIVRNPDKLKLHGSGR